jgi:hypothetical protein
VESRHRIWSTEMMIIHSSHMIFGDSDGNKDLRIEKVLGGWMELDLPYAYPSPRGGPRPKLK